MANPVATPALKATYIGGPTVLLEVAGLRLLTDPTFDPAGSSAPAGDIVLRKHRGPALDPDALGPIDAVLLSHDHHYDNLDHAGRALLARVPAILTTPSGARRLGPPAIGLAPWASTTLAMPDGGTLHITGTPARHGPAGYESISGEVTGFLLSLAPGRESLAYLTGDTVWYDGVAEVARRSDPALVFAFAGAAMPRGTYHVTMSTNDAIETAAAFPGSTIVPLHYEGWDHFTQDAGALAKAFAIVGMADRLRVLEAGVPTPLA
jgi:L-ascorbate metabolism protein UlaG (beta-lactamase superfamily)